MSDRPQNFSAEPVLASTLLNLQVQSTSTGVRSWRLQRGGLHIEGLDQRFNQIWRGGSVVGIGAADLDKFETSLSLHLLASALLRSRFDAIGASDQQGTSKDQIQPSSSSSFIVYIVAPHTSQTIPLLHAILAKRMSNSAAAMDLLKKVQLLQFFDLAGLVESIGEVSESIYQFSQAIPKSHPFTASYDNTNQGPRTIVLIEGLAPTLTAAQRRSGIVRANALLAGLVRSITQLSQLSAWPLVLISVLVGVQLAGQPGNETQLFQRDGQGIPLESAFSGPNGEDYRLICGSVSLSRALEASLDRLIHVGDALGRVPVRQRHKRVAGQYVVEVIKDRIGSMTGLWTTWKVPKP